MKKAILFPFQINNDNHQRYTTVMELAQVSQLPVICFSTIDKGNTAGKLDEIYLYLLKLNGHYRTAFNNWHTCGKITIKPIIRKGNYTEQLQLFVEQTSLELFIFHEAGEAQS